MDENTRKTMTELERNLTEELSQWERDCMDLEDDLENMKWSKERLEDELSETQAALEEAREALRLIQSEFNSGREN